MDKYNRVYASIDLDALIHNVKACRKRLSEGSILMPVVKADGYGHGAIPISKVLVENGIKRLAVATLEEAISLRKHNIDVPILILGYTPDNMAHKVITYDLIQTVYKYSMAENLSKAAEQYKKKANIHLKLDTGMGRIGFIPHDESIDTISRIFDLPHLRIEGIYTHFSKADEADKTFTYNQLDQFDQFVKKLEDKGCFIPIKHTANSAGIIDIDEAHKDIVRLGISLYGFYPSMDVQKNKVDLQPVLSLISHIIHIKEVEAGTYIGYGGTYRTKGKAKIATIPVGYGDGYDRLLSSKGSVLIGGEYAPIVGRVCMDQFMVDVTHIEGVKDLDEVVLIGKQGKNHITADDIARIKGTINYEVVCQLGKRIPRVYMRNHQVVACVDYFE
ncbi:alanine racemase [Vallitalea pronyensis]|uniref:Alanine racemase n=1 Tax=Vallitalea pronyensis TaxID=1348613 RepID=A0A8J8SH12_9FIRM|nr:alanine racemase [Vallitalea pronyensis]QUI22888.1 alanine racemase [Vallitalea pronyensis]